MVQIVAFAVAQTIALATAIAAWRAATASRTTAEATLKAWHGQLLTDLLDDYAAEDMLVAMDTLRAWRMDKGKEFAREFKRQRDARSEAVNPVNQSRRRVAHYLYKVYRLSTAQLLDDGGLRAAMPGSTAEFCCEIVEPLEAGVRPNYDPAAYKWVAALRDKPRYKDLFPRSDE